MEALRSAASSCSSKAAFDDANQRTKLDQEPVAGGFDHPPAMLRDDRISRGATLVAGPEPCPLRRSPSAASSHDIGCENVGETAGLAHVASLGSGRRLASTPSRSVTRWLAASTIAPPGSSLQLGSRPQNRGAVIPARPAAR
jgi:hypothetical protein